MIADADLAYGLSVPVPPERGHGEGVIQIPRSLDVLRRVESRFGAIDPLARRLDVAAVTQAELSSLIVTLLAGVGADADVPPRGEIDAWLFEAGTHAIAKRLSFELFAMVMGAEALAAQLRLMRTAKPAAKGEPDDDRPFVMTAGSTGRGGS